MAFAATTCWETRADGSDTNGGGFDPGNANMSNTLSCTSGNTSAPVVSSSVYNFVAGDVGHYLFIKSGTSWKPGWYLITAVSSNQATLDAAIGHVEQYGTGTRLNTVVGCHASATGSTGTWSVDYSRTASARLSYTDLVIGGTTTQFTSAANPVNKNLVGNIINITSGTGFTVQRVQISSTSSTTATCDKSLGTGGSTGGNGNLGGAFQKWYTAVALNVAGNVFFIRGDAGSYTQTASGTISNNGGSWSTAAPPSRVMGYTTYRGDNGKPSITTSGSSITIVSASGRTGWCIENLDIDCNSQTSSAGIAFGGGASNSLVRRCRVRNFTSVGINVTGSGSSFTVEENEVSGGTSAATAGIFTNSGTAHAYGNYVHDNACTGISGCLVNILNIVVRNTGASSDGIVFGGAFGGLVLFNTVYSNGRDGISNNSANHILTLVMGNLLVSNGRYGILYGTSSMFNDLRLDGNAFYNNTTAPRNNAGAVTGQFAIGGVVYELSRDVILTADPFSDASGSNFSLNTTSGGGAAARGSAPLASFPGYTGTSYVDFGAIQTRPPMVSNRSLMSGGRM